MIKITGTLHQELCTFMTKSRLVLLDMGNVSDKRCRENKTHILCSVTFFFRKSRCLRDIVGKLVEQETLELTI